MHCQVMDTLYVRSNGDVPCAHDAGEPIILGHVGPQFDVLAMLDGEKYRHVRASLATGQRPWPGVCERCACFRPEIPYRDELSARRVHKLQIEASLACNLACPACTNAAQVKVRPRPFTLDLEQADDMLRDLRDEGFSIGEIEYAGQGEPLAHPRLPELVDLGRALFPETRQRLITNGNFEYWTRTGGRALDEIYVSCDGAFQASYEKYRIGGSIDQAFRFMREAPGMLSGRRQLRVWKYILFEFNDSDEEICAAQERAQEIGVDTLLFIFTDSAFRSTRWTPANAALFPRLYPNVLVHGTPSVDRRHSRSIACVRGGQSSWFLRLAGTSCHVDEVLVSDNCLNVRGWAYCRMPITRIEVAIDAVSVGDAHVRLPRLDVPAQVAWCKRPDVGFAFSRQLPALDGEHEIALSIFAGPVRLGTVQARYAFN
jgi:organic radical activating enzyme